MIGFLVKATVGGIIMGVAAKATVKVLDSGIVEKSARTATEILTEIKMKFEELEEQGRPVSPTLQEKLQAFEDILNKRANGVRTNQEGAGQ